MGRIATLGCGLGVVQVDQINQGFPGHNRFHLSQKTLSFGAFLGRGLLVITLGEAFRAAVAKLLTTHELWPML
jgi:hypothetical protein